MSSVRNETVSSNKSLKKAGGKTKHGKPTGRREVLEKYKAINLNTLDCDNHKQLGIQDRVFGYAVDRYATFVVPILSNERLRTNRLTLRDQVLSFENEESPEEV